MHPMLVCLSLLLCETASIYVYPRHKIQDVVESTTYYTTTTLQPADPSTLAVDLGVATDSTTIECLKIEGFHSLLVDIYDPATRSPNLHADNTIRLASQKGLSTAALHVPDPSFDANSQIDQSIKALQAGGINVRMIWLQVTSDGNWNFDSNVNRQFIQTALQRVWRYGIQAGIMTSRYDWDSLTAGFSILPNTPLWYINVTSSDNFNDFVPFGPWTQPYAKKFKANTGVCGIAKAGSNVICEGMNCAPANPTTASTYKPWGTSTYNPLVASSSTFNPWASSTSYNPRGSTDRPQTTKSPLEPCSSSSPWSGASTASTPCALVNTTCAILFRDDCQNVVVYDYEWLYDFDETTPGFDGNITRAFVMAECTLKLYTKPGWKGESKTYKETSGGFVDLSTFPGASSAKCQCPS